MARLCERPGCSVPADVSYGFDADTLVVWLDTFQADTGARAGVLCLRHADAMVVPLGWMLDDRRDPVPRLFRTAAGPAARPAPRRVCHERPHMVQLSLEADDVTGELIISPQRLAAALALDITAEIPRPAAVEPIVVEPIVVEPVVVEPVVVEPVVVEPVVVEPVVVEPVVVEPVVLQLVVADDPAIEEPAADDATDEPAGDEVGDEVAGDETSDEAGEDETVILPWQPRFDQSDDLKGLLRARGRLLQRAFRGQTAESG
jgi:hypothetical protein